MKLKKINIKNIKFQSKFLKSKIEKDLNLITKKKRFKKLNLSKNPILMGVVNLTPDSFSDGGKYNKRNLGFTHAKKLLEKGCKILDIGGGQLDQVPIQLKKKLNGKE